MGSKPSSYFLELLTIHLAKKNPNLQGDGPAAFVKSFLDCLKEAEKLDITFDLAARIPSSVRRYVWVLDTFLLMK